MIMHRADVDSFVDLVYILVLLKVHKFKSDTEKIIIIFFHKNYNILLFWMSSTEIIFFSLLIIANLSGMYVDLVKKLEFNSPPPPPWLKNIYIYVPFDILCNININWIHVLFQELKVKEALKVCLVLMAHLV